MAREMWVRRAWVLGLALLTLTVAASLALAAANIQAPSALLGIQQRAIQLPPARLARVTAGKQVADINQLQQSYLVRNNVPFFRIGTQEQKLLPLSALEFQPSAAQVQASQVLAGPLLQYRNWILEEPIGLPPELPEVVDRRPNQTPIKNQNPRGTCVCFASMAGLEVAYGGGTLDLSENYANYLYMKAESRGCKDDGLATHMSAEYLAAHGVCGESICPYQSSSFPAFCNNGANPAPAQRATADSKCPYKIRSYQKIWRKDDLASDTGLWINNPNYLEAMLRSGKDIVYGTHVAGWTGNVTGIVDVKLGADGKPLPSVGGHAMLIVGYNHSEGYFIVKNSWGTGVGQSGYLYLSYDYIRTYAKYGYVINEVEPLAIRMIAPALRAMPRVLPTK